MVEGEILARKSNGREVEFSLNSKKILKMDLLKDEDFGMLLFGESKTFAGSKINSLRCFKLSKESMSPNSLLKPARDHISFGALRVIFN